MFTPIENPLIGTTRLYMPQGYSPFDPSQADLDDVTLVLAVGDAVTVESAWNRDYLEHTSSNPVLFYVRSHRTGHATHVVERDIKLELPLGTKRAFGLKWRPRPFPETDEVTWATEAEMTALFGDRK